VPGPGLILPNPAKKEAHSASLQPPEFAVPTHPECVIKETPRRMLLVLIDLGIYPPRGGYTPSASTQLGFGRLWPVREGMLHTKTTTEIGESHWIGNGRDATSRRSAGKYTGSG